MPKEEIVLEGPPLEAIVANMQVDANDDTPLDELPPPAKPYVGSSNDFMSSDPPPPPVIPPPDRPKRNTNQLQYLLRHVWKPIYSHQYAWPFYHQADEELLGLTDYHTVIKHPMDLDTIRKRLENNDYWNAQECIDDFKRIFSNCYTFYEPDHDLIPMAQTLEKLFLAQVAHMPKEEVEVELEIPPPL